MNNAELIKALRYCGKNVGCSKCPIYDEPRQACFQILTSAADAIERLQAEVEELTAKVPRWIPVTERLPEKSGIYLTADMDDEYLFVKTLHYSDKWRGWNCIESVDDEAEARVYELHITHWMQLPELPEVDA